MKALLKGFLHFCFPKYCTSCNVGLIHTESPFCLSCYLKLCRVEEPNYASVLGDKLWGRVSLEEVFPLYYFQKESVLQEALHSLKYYNAKEIGVWFGSQLSISFDFQDVDFIVPVPMDRVKEKVRGYNQALLIAEALSVEVGIPVNDSILRMNKKSMSLSKLARKDRFEMIHELVSVNLGLSHELEGKHILLLDDLVTTGATVEACVSKLQIINDVRISIVCVGVAIT